MGSQVASGRDPAALAAERALAFMDEQAAAGRVEVSRSEIIAGAGVPEVLWPRVLGMLRSCNEVRQTKAGHYALEGLLEPQMLVRGAKVWATERPCGLPVVEGLEETAAATEPYVEAPASPAEEATMSEGSGTPFCAGECQPLCAWCSAAHNCPADCGGGDECPYAGIGADPGDVLPAPVTARGMHGKQGIWALPADVEAAVLAQMEVQHG